MKYSIILILFFLVITTIKAQDQFPHVQGEVLVQVKEGKSIDKVLQSLQYHKDISTKLTIKRQLSKQLNIWQLEFDATTISHNTMLNQVLTSSLVEAAQLNYITQKRATPNDVNYAQQWQYEQASDFDLDAEAAWDITTGGVTALGDTIVVCVIDDGLEVNHPDWKDNIWYNHNEIPNNGIDDDGNGYVDDYRGWNADGNNNNILPPNPWNTHGTPVAGIIAAQGNDSTGVTGVNWNVKLMFVIGGGTNAAAIAAYDYPLACRRLYNQTNGTMGAFVVATNASWGVDNQDCSTYAPLVNAIYDSLGMQGVLNATATTNSNTNVDTQGDFPTTCTSDYLIGVTNMQRNGSKVTSAGYGATHIDLGAYGEGTYTIATGQSYNSFGGTSGATPHVAGAIGLMYAAPCQRFALLARQQPAQTALLIKQFLLSSTVNHPTLQGIAVSEGVLNLKNALDSVMNIGCSLSGCHEPYQLVAAGISGTSTTVSWEVIDSTTQYFYRYRALGSNNWNIGAVTDTFIMLNGLLQCNEYEIQTAADCDSSNYSQSLIFKTKDCCTAPTNVNILREGLTTASITWDTVSIANSYIAEYKKYTDSTWLSLPPTSSDSLTLTGLDSCAVYEVRLKSNCTVNINNTYSNITILETDGCGSCSKGAYCPSAGSNTNDDWLERVTLASINNTSGNNNGYASFVKDNITATLATATNYPIDIDLGFNTGFWATNWRLKVWIDYNQDEAFDPITELAYDAGAITTATRNHTGIVNIPANATLGKTRMRVSMKWGNTDIAPCDNPTYGEVEDYCIYIAALTSTSELLSQNNSLVVYPNPFNNTINLKINSSGTQKATIQVINLAGQLVYQQKQVLSAGKQQINLPLKDVTQGVYCVKVQLGKEVLVKKIIKQ